MSVPDRTRSNRLPAEATTARLAVDRTPGWARTTQQLQRALANPRAAAADLLGLQRTVGNRAVLQLLAAGGAQPKLRVGPANDAFEQEADRAAEMVMKQPRGAAKGKEGPAAVGTARGAPVRRKLPAAASTAAAGFDAGPSVQRRLEAGKGSGQPLNPDTRAQMEAGFGADFSQVRVHTSGEAVQLSRGLNAQAFTHGRDIYFDAGKYAPGSGGGQKLLAHELAHVVQQGGHGGGRVQRKIGSKAERAMVFAEAQQPGYTYNEIFKKSELDWYKTAAWLPANISEQIVHIRSAAEKKAAGGDQTVEDRLEFSRAYLLKVFATEWYLKLVDNRNSGKFDGTPQDSDRKAAVPSALNRALKEKKRLQGFGVAKAGNVRPELLTLGRVKYEATRETDASGVLFDTIDRSVVAKGSTGDTTPRIEWRGTRIPNKAAPLRKLGLRVHSIIVYNGPDGIQNYISAHADGAGKPKLKATKGLYTPDADTLWEPISDRMKLEEGPQVVGKFAALEKAADSVNKMNLTYKLLTINCNRAAYHILKTAGVKTKNPAGLYFGWGKRLGQGGDTEEDQQPGTPKGQAPQNNAGLTLSEDDTAPVPGERPGFSLIEDQKDA